MVNKIKEYLKQNGYDAAIINDNDPHISEYIEAHYKFRNVVSGFTGSNGYVVVLPDEASLYTDGRYYIQAERELINGVMLKKLGEPTEIKYYDYILQGKDSAKVLIDYSLFSTDEVLRLQAKGLELIDYDFSYLWEDKPARNITDMFLLTEWVDPFSEKLAKLKEMMKKDKVDAYVTAKLDDTSYLLNLRSRDIPSNPTITSFLYLDEDQTVVFTDNYTSVAIDKYLAENNITLKPYSEVYNFMSNISGEKKIALDTSFTNYKIYNALLSNAGVTIKEVADYLFLMKSTKSEKELEGMRLAHIHDGVALAEFWSDVLENKDQYNEFELHEKLVNYRKAASSSYIEESFAPICAAGSNAAMMHYSAKEGNCSNLKGNAMLLVDTGGHYFEGTTDITRTFALDQSLVTDKIRKCFTLTLKGVIDLTTTKFFDKCTGGHLDVICRKPLWEVGLDYKCGTGHGVGHIMNVHEGPRSFRIDNQDYKLVKGVYITIEPGVYLENEFGIRIEQNVFVDDYKDYGLDHYYQFKTLTLVPIDRTLIDKSLLNEEEVAWLNAYHKEVFETLKDKVSRRALKFLEEYTKEI